MTSLLTRARQLRLHRRYEEAVAMLLQHLAAFPEDPSAFQELALCRMDIPGMMNEALSNARTAVGLQPGHPFPLILEAEILTRLDRDEESLAIANRALAIDPDYVPAWKVRAMAEGGLSRWKESEASVRKALALDPDDAGASNMLAHALRVQGRLDESEAENRRRLARDPENAFAFATTGWSSLQRGNVREAEGYFKEALRIDPNLKHAREGLKTAYRSRAWFYRIFLKWSLFLQRFSKQNRVGLLIGIYFGFRVLRYLAESVNVGLAMGLSAVYGFIIFGTWLADGIANLLVLRDPVARLSLDRSEKLEGLLIGGSFVIGLVTLVTGIVMNSNATIAAGLTFLLIGVPGSMLFNNLALPGRVAFSAATALVALFGLTASKAVLHADAEPFTESKAMPGMIFAFLVTMGCTWLSMVPALRRKRAVA
ncbi:MAG: tetratricopeptide repeat protein [Luteolibacter sp.]